MEQRRPRNATDAVAESAFSFADMYDVHVSEVYRFVHRRCQDHSLAEDITQETFVQAIRSTDDPSSISIGWLLTVAKNRLIDVLRRQAQYEGKLRLVGTRTEYTTTIEPAERLRVVKALNTLRLDHRLVLTLHYIDGLTVPAIAEHLDRSVKSVEGLVTRARRELRAALDEGNNVSETGGGHD